MIDLLQMLEELKRDEGFKDKVYMCTAGKLTIGYGHNLEDNPISPEVAERILSTDTVGALEQCEQFNWFHTLDPVRQRVIVNMVFNIGFNGVSKFQKMIEAIIVGDYEIAAEEMIDSLWYGQVGERAERLVHMMRYGTVK